MAAGRTGAAGAHSRNNNQLGAIVEDEEDEEEDEKGREATNNAAGGGGAARTEDVPQAFSHFTWDCTAGRKLVCDLQVRRRQAMIRWSLRGSGGLVWPRGGGWAGAHCNEALHAQLRARLPCPRLYVRATGCVELHRRLHAD